ncbi:macro domain-containing protein [Clostridium perfringens]|uniref:macro domain-containing protein n=1 Tax=Clostridium perfringens TaxID=1502 RepID=UPI002341E107|nr:macro domain-containing protein [Clostridium perfringens]MDC4251911.1 macro domain-containing protein [Clostridium perfringens]
MIEFVSGDFFDYDADIRINTVNCVGVMGAGVALVFKKKYPDMFLDYSNACKRKEVQPGKPHVWEYSDLLSNFTIINFPTKVHWRNPSEYWYIEEGLIWLRSFLLKREKSIVTLPALGCGHGGLEWQKVKLMIEKYLGDLSAKVLVFEPSSSIQIVKDKVSDIELEKNDINRLLPNDKFYPEKLLGRSALELYYKGNISLIHKKSIALVTNSKPTEREKNALIRIINELPPNKFIFLLGLNNSYEIDLAREILSRGFKAIIIVPYGILQLKVRKDLQPLWNYENILVLSMLNPSQEWKKYHSVNSLKLRLEIADITLINSYDYKYFIRYMNEMKKAKSDIFYINYWNEDIEFYSSLSAKKIGRDSETNRPNIMQLLSSVNNK